MPSVGELCCAPQPVCLSTSALEPAPHQERLLTSLACLQIHRPICPLPGEIFPSQSQRRSLERDWADNSKPSRSSCARGAVQTPTCVFRFKKSSNSPCCSGLCGVFPQETLHNWLVKLSCSFCRDRFRNPFVCCRAVAKIHAQKGSFAWAGKFSCSIQMEV